MVGKDEVDSALENPLILKGAFNPIVLLISIFSFPFVGMAFLMENLILKPGYYVIYNLIVPPWKEFSINNF